MEPTDTNVEAPVEAETATGEEQTTNTVDTEEEATETPVEAEEEVKEAVDED